MNRRNLLKSIATGTAGAALAGGQTAKTASKKPQSSFIQADDDTSLFYKDWGSGSHVLFVHSWGLHSDLWQYQMIRLIDHGMRCATFDRRGHGRSSDPGRGYT